MIWNARARASNMSSISLPLRSRKTSCVPAQWKYRVAICASSVLLARKTAMFGRERLSPAAHNRALSDRVAWKAQREGTHARPLQHEHSVDLEGRGISAFY